MVRVSFSEIGFSPWLLSEDEFLSRVEAMAKTQFADAPPGRISVEAIDDFDRIKWRAYYANVTGLELLAREIIEGREASAHRAGHVFERPRPPQKCA